LAVDFLDQKLWSAGEVIDLLSLPVIGEIPAMQTAQEIRTASRIGRFQAAGYVVLVALCAAAVYLVYRTPRVREFGVETLAKVLGW